MKKAEIGMLAKSKAGHDKNHIYVIIDVDDTYVYLADGNIRSMNHPKKKKEKHIQLICKKCDTEHLDDVKIKRLLKVFGKEMRGE